MKVRRPRKRKKPLREIGWREWVGLPDLGIGRMKAKVDTGARTSALHAFDIERVERDGAPWVRFRLHPIQRDWHAEILCQARLVGERWVRPSSGKATLRPVIRIRCKLSRLIWPIEVTLVRRDLMGFRMLLGRQAVRQRFIIDPGRSFVAERRSRGEKA